MRLGAPSCILPVLAGTSLFGAPGALLALPVVATAGGFLSAYVERHDVVEDPLARATTQPLSDKPGQTDPSDGNDREQDAPNEC